MQKLASSPAGLALIASKDTGLAWDYAPHLRYLNRALLDVARGETRFLMVFMPPGHAKSSIISEAFPAWMLGMYPNTQIILSTYGQTFSETWGRKSRDLLSAYGPSLYGVQVREDSKSVAEWRITGKRGVMYCVGIGGQVTGKRADLAIIDDPVKNQAEAESEVYRENLHRWFQQTLYTRLTTRGSIILCMTRWHHDDLAGQLLRDRDKGQGLPWRVIKLPALAEADDALGRTEGDPLWPKLYGAERLREVRSTLTDVQWLAMYQQEPVLAGGAIWRREWFNRRYSAKDVEQARKSKTLRSKFRIHRIANFVDSAWADGVQNDYSVIATWAATDTDYLLLDVWRAKVDYPSLKRAIVDQHVKWGAHATYVENKASGIPALQELRLSTRLPILPFEPQGSKVARAQVVTPIAESGHVMLPDEAEWLQEWIDEHIRFPRARYDDQPDTSSMALLTLRDAPNKRIVAF